MAFDLYRTMFIMKTKFVGNKENLKMVVTRKQSTPNFPKN